MGEKTCSCRATGRTDEQPVCVGTRLSWRDRLRHWQYRWGLGRMSAAVTPGLYRVGSPSPEAPVLVSANYRMSFDVLRSRLAGRDAWILVIDTQGINVWCAAGKGTFGTDEIIRRVLEHHLEQWVSHRRLIVPQLGAPGVAAHTVRRETGFAVQYGPVRAADLPAYLDRGKATEAMRRVTFTLAERLPLAPMELAPVFLPVLGMAAFLFLMAGWKVSLVFFILGVSAPVAVPLLHDVLPGRWLSVKGALYGLAASLLLGWLARLPWLASASLAVLTTALAAYVALNFTGSTTYTSVNGVKREMRLTLPFMLSGAALSLVGWILIFLGKG